MSLEELQAELIEGGCDKKEQVIALIKAMLAPKPLHPRPIFARLKAMGYNEMTTGMQLLENEGLKGQALWDINDKGRFVLKP